MPDIFATLIVTAANVSHARTLAAEIPGGEGMFTAGLSASGKEPATHYISSGWILAEIVDALPMCAISNLPPDEAMTDKGLKSCAPSAT